METQKNVDIYPHFIYRKYKLMNIFLREGEAEVMDKACHFGVMVEHVF